MVQIWDGHETVMGRSRDGHETVKGQIWDRFSVRQGNDITGKWPLDIGENACDRDAERGRPA